MALSIHTNYSAMVTTNTLNKTNSALASSQQALGTGYRINNAADDAAGLQMATRLKAQSNGMDMAMRNTDNAVSFLQTAEGAFSEMTDIVDRMKNLATLASNDTNSGADLIAMQSEYDELGLEIANIIKNTKFAGENLFSDGTKTDGTGGKLSTAVTFQIGAASAEKLELNVGTALGTLATKLGAISESYDAVPAGTPPVLAAGTELASTGDASTAKNTKANAMIDTLAGALDDITALRSKFGATINRLGHTANNLANMKDNTDAAYGGLMDTDFAKESANLTRNNMLMQSGISMLKQAGQMPGMVMSLLG